MGPAAQRTDVLVARTALMAPVRGDAPEAVQEAEGPSVRAFAWGLALLSSIVAGTHLILGPNFVVEDWHSVSVAVTGGSWTSTSPEIARARPGVGLAYGATFGVFGNHPLPIFGILSVLNVGTGQALFRGLIPLVTTRAAAAVVALWILLPNHVSLEVWASASMITISLALAGWTVARAAKPDLSGLDRVAAVLLALGSSMFYEASMPLVSASLLAVPWLVCRRFDFALVAGGAVTQGVLAIWLVTNMHDTKVGRDFVHPRRLADGLFGGGIVSPVVGQVLVPLVAVSVAVVAFACVGQRRDFGVPARLIAVGSVVSLLGFVPFARFFYNDIIVGDRVFYISSVGGAMIMVGLGWLVVRFSPALAGVMALTLLILASPVRWSESQAWDRAGNDGVAILAATEKKIPNPDGPILLGPAVAYHHTTTAFGADWVVAAAVRALYETDSVTGMLTLDAERFARHPEDLRIDITEVLDAEATSEGWQTWWLGDIAN